MDLSDERSRIEQAQSDPQAFGPLYEQYVDRIYAYIYRRTGDKHLTEDITAATFETALARLSTYRWQDTGIAPWFYRIARNNLIQHYRRQRFLAPLRLLAKRQEGRASANFVGQVEIQDTLTRALNQLSAQDQDIVSLRFFDDLSTAEVAVILNCSRENVYLRLHRALQRLRKQIEVQEQEGVEAYG